jgi:surface protein
MNFEGIDSALPSAYIPDDVMFYIISFLDVPTLVQKKAVCRSWQRLFTHIIDQKAPTPIPFESNTELRKAVCKYTEYRLGDADYFANTYGWPIGRWDVSNVEDFSGIFDLNTSFNESIGSWDTSSVTNMSCMFADVASFNQNISFWDTSSVENMSSMFLGATSFNHDLSSWNVSRVTDMSFMFAGAASFNQDISSWDTSRCIFNCDPCRYPPRRYPSNAFRWDIVFIVTLAGVLVSHNKVVLHVSQIDNSSVSFKLGS